MNEKKNINDLIKILRKLRSPNGCEWDRKQTSKSLLPYLLEETYELIEAVENQDYNNIKEELGDLLLHIIFQSELYREKKVFSINEVIETISNKMIERHPEVFTNQKLKKNWELNKKKEKKRNSVLDGIPKTLPALAKSSRIQEKAASVGFNWKSIDLIWNKIEEEIIELKEAYSEQNESKIIEETGDLLFSIVNLSRFLNVNSEESLKFAISKFEKRFHKLEKEIKFRNKSISDCNEDEMNEIWDIIKNK